MRAYLELVRAPAALTALGDTLVGARAPLRGRRLLSGHVPMPAALMALHTLGVTTRSRGEVHGTSPAVAKAVVCGTAVTALITAAGGRLTGIAAAVAYAVSVGVRNGRWCRTRQPDGCARRPKRVCTAWCCCNPRSPGTGRRSCWSCRRRGR